MITRVSPSRLFKYESLVGGMLTKEEYASYKAKYTKQAEDIKESIRVLKKKTDRCAGKQK